jgi:hypothetical protein
MSAGLQVEKNAKMQDVKRQSEGQKIRRSEDQRDQEKTSFVQSTPEPSVDPARGQGGLLSDGNGQQEIAQSTLDPGVDSVRSQGGPVVRGNEHEAAIKSLYDAAEIEAIASLHDAAEAKETSATESDNSEPRLVTTLIKTVQGMQHTLDALTQGIKEMIRNKKWAKKAHARRERRRDAKHKEVENQPQIPADCSQTQPPVGDYGIKAEAGSQPPTEDWAPTELDEVKKVSDEEKEVYEVALSDDFEEPATTQKKPEQSLTPQQVAIMRRDAKRMLRATKGIAHTMLRATQEVRAKKPKPEKRNMKIYVTLNDRIGLPFLKQRNVVSRRSELRRGRGRSEST